MKPTFRAFYGKEGAFLPTARMLWRICHFLAPAGQPEMMHKNFMHQHLRFFVVQHACMKFYVCVSA